jgi:hypothetical protein
MARNMKWTTSWKESPWKGGEVELWGRRCVHVRPVHASLRDRNIVGFDVNWSAFGAVSLKEADQFLAALKLAINKAKILTKMYVG